MYACVFHGDEQMCQMGNTRSIQQDVSENAVWHWNEHIEFDIEVRDIARGARLCLGIYAIYSGTKKARRKNKDVSAIYLVHVCMLWSTN